MEFQRKLLHSWDSTSNTLTAVGDSVGARRGAETLSGSVGGRTDGSRVQRMMRLSPLVLKNPTVTIQVRRMVLSHFCSSGSTNSVNVVRAG